MKTLVEESINNGGRISPLIIEDGYYDGVGYMNPSVFVDDDGDILVNLRHINYSLYHSENTQQFPTRWGPLSYLHPESDQHLKTVNYLCRLNSDLEMINYSMIDTSLLDKPAMWEFHGLEDARLVKWDNKYYTVGVRRDTTPNGQGRMELSEISINKENWEIKEVSRLRIPAPGEDNTYCEKNWVPILDKPYHFIKWTAPTEIVKTYPDLPPRCEQVSLKQGLTPPADQRGGTHVVKWGNFYIAMPHEVYLFNNYLGRKDGIYRHRLCVWDESFNLVGISPNNISFLNGRIEFAAGMANYGADLLITFGFADNCGYILQVPKDVVNNLVREALLNVQ